MAADAAAAGCGGAPRPGSAVCVSARSESCATAVRGSLQRQETLIPFAVVAASPNAGLQSLGVLGEIMPLLPPTSFFHLLFFFFPRYACFGLVCWGGITDGSYLLVAVKSGWQNSYHTARSTASRLGHVSSHALLIPDKYLESEIAFVNRTEKQTREVWVRSEAKLGNPRSQCLSGSTFAVPHCGSF